MSDNTQDSGSSRRSFKARIPISASDATSSIKNGLTHLGDSISRGMESFKDRGTNLHGRMANRDSSVYSKGVRELDNYGYERYNIKDDSEIFISRLSDKALFNDGEPVLVRATEGNFVGSSDPFATNSEVKAESEPAPEDARSLFKNVPLSSQQSNTYVGVVGVNNGGHIEVTRPGFLDKMTRVSNVHPAPSIEVADDEGDDDHVIIESKPEETTKDYDSLMSRIVSAPRHEAADAVEEAVPETQVETPVEEVQAEPAPVLNEDVFVGMPAAERHEEFFIEAEPEAEEPETLDCDSNVEVEDYDWFFEDDETEAQADVPVEETPVIEIEAPVEADIEAVIEQEVAESVIDEAVVGAVIDEVVAAEAAKPAEVIEGLHVEGSEPSSDVVASSIEATMAVPQMAATGSAVATRPGCAIDAEGEALPPMADPVITRPRSTRSARFKFSNGMLVSVDKEESKEGLQSPLE